MEFVRVVDDEAGIAAAVSADGESGHGVLYVVANVAESVEDLEVALLSVDGDSDEDALEQLAGREGPSVEEVLRMGVKVLAAGSEREGDEGQKQATCGQYRKTTDIQRKRAPNLIAAA